MGEERITDDRLAALADGELPADEAAELRRAIAADLALAERFSLFVETRQLLAPEQIASSIAAEEAALARLAAAVRAADAAPTGPALRVVEGARREAPAPQARRLEPRAARPASRFRVAAPAMAASLALVIGGIAGYALGGRSGADAGSDAIAIAGPPAARAALASALDTAKSGDAVDWNDGAMRGAITVIASHRLEDGRVCREFEATLPDRGGPVVGLACRGAGGGWRAEIAARGRVAGEGYSAASAMGIVEGALADLGSPGPLGAEEERSLLAAGWPAPRR